MLPHQSVGSRHYTVIILSTTDHREDVDTGVRLGVVCGGGGGGSGQVWGEQRVAASTLRRYSFGLHLAIAQADARPVMPISLR